MNKPDDFEQALLDSIRVRPTSGVRVELQAVTPNKIATSGLLMCDGPVPLAQIEFRSQSTMTAKEQTDMDALIRDLRDGIAR